ncbi:MAG: hypothetical protein ACPGKS_05805 [Coraliomargarita sp.]
MTPIVTLCATGAAVLYAIGSLDIKKALARGTDRRAAIAWTNIAMAIWSLPLFFLSRELFTLQGFMLALAAGVALFLGRIFVVKALDVGALSIVGPLLGLKTLFVASFAVILGQVALSPAVWIAVLLASVGMALVQRGPKSKSKAYSRAIFYAVIASLLFASTDILVVEARESLSVGWLMPTLFLTVGLLVPLLGTIPTPPLEGRANLKRGSILMGFQTSVVVLAICLTGQAVVVNIIYASRGLWSVVVDRLMNRTGTVHEYFAQRAAGAVLLVASVGIVVVTMSTTLPETETLGSASLSDSDEPSKEAPYENISGAIWIDGY